MSGGWEDLLVKGYGLENVFLHMTLGDDSNDEVAGGYGSDNRQSLLVILWNRACMEVASEVKGRLVLIKYRTRKGLWCQV